LIISDDAERCSLNTWAYWTLRSIGFSPNQASSALKRRSIDEKLQVLSNNAISFYGVPAWQKHGTGIYWEHYLKDGFNPKTNETVKVLRRQLKIDEHLPIKEDYAKLIFDILGSVSNDSVTISIS